MAEDLNNFWGWFTKKPSIVTHDSKAGGTQSNTVIGEVMRVNNEKFTCDVQYLYGGRTSLMNDVPIGLPFVTRQGFLGGMPEVGSRVVMNLIPVTKENLTPIIVAFLPPYFPVQAYNHDTISSSANVNSEFASRNNPFVKLRNQRLYPGEIFISSDRGSDLRLDEDLVLSNSKLSEIHLRSSDQSIVLNSLQYYRATDASTKVEGMVTRYLESRYDSSGNFLSRPTIGSVEVHDNFGLDITTDTEKRFLISNGVIDAAGSLITPDLSQTAMMLDDGRYNWIRTLSGKSSIDTPYLVANPSDFLYHTALPLTESRYAIKELGDAILDQSFPFHTSDAEIRTRVPVGPFVKPPTSAYISHNLIESAQGTLVGYDFMRRPESYGRVLRHQLFSDENTTRVVSDEIPITDDTAPDYGKTRTWAVASMWKMPSSLTQTRFYVNKEGYISFHVGSTRSQREHLYMGHRTNETSLHQTPVNPVGTGRSVEGSFGGSVRLLVEKDYKEESLELTALGRSFINLGCDDRTGYGYRHTLIEGDEVNVGLLDPEDMKTYYPSHFSERISVDMTTDGGMVLRVGKSFSPTARKFRHNGYDAKGINFDLDKYQNSKNLNKETGNYGVGDVVYRFHDMALPSIKAEYPWASSTPVISNPDKRATSLDAHLCGDMMLRVGADDIDNKSLVMDLAGALVAAIGKDSHDSRSIQAVLDGGIEIDVGRIKKTGNAIQGILRGDVDLKILPSNPHVQEDEGGSIDPVSHSQKKGYGTTTAGLRERLHKGTMKTSIEGNYTSHVQGSHSLRVGGSHNTNINGDLNTFTMGAQKINIANATFFTGKLSAFELTAGAGNIRHATLVGDIKADTKLGNLSQSTLAGNIDYTTLAGNVKVSTSLGNFEGSTILGNVSVGTLAGNASMTTKLGNVEVTTALGNATFGTEIGMSTLKSQILTEVVAQAMVQIKSLLTVVDSKLIQLGGPASIHPVPKGDQLLLWLMTHVHGMPGTPPVIPPTPALLSTVTFTS